MGGDQTKLDPHALKKAAGDIEGIADQLKNNAAFNDLGVPSPGVFQAGYWLKDVTVARGQELRAHCEEFTAVLTNAGKTLRDVAEHLDRTDAQNADAVGKMKAKIESDAPHLTADPDESAV